MERAAQVRCSLFVATALKNHKFHLQENFLIAWNRASLHAPSPASSVSMLVHFHEVPIPVGKPVKGSRMMF